MILDSLTTFSDSQDIHAASCASDFSYDAGVRGNYDDALISHTGSQKLGSGKQRVAAAIVLTDVVVASGAPTLQVSVQQSPDNATWTDLVISEVLDAATLTSLPGNGYQFDLGLPSIDTEQYLQVYYTIGGTGSFTSMLATASLYAYAGLQSNRTW